MSDFYFPPGAIVGIPYRSDCKCPCHTPGVTMMHFRACCRPDEMRFADKVGMLKGDGSKIISEEVLRGTVREAGIADVGTPAEPNS